MAAIVFATFRTVGRFENAIEQPWRAGVSGRFKCQNAHMPECVSSSSPMTVLLFRTAALLRLAGGARSRCSGFVKVRTRTTASVLIVASLSIAQATLVSAPLPIQQVAIGGRPVQSPMEYADWHCCLAEGPPLVLRVVRGTAVSEGGSVLHDVEVGVFTEPAHHFLLQTRSDEKGRFRIPRLPPGSYRLVARADGFDSGNVGIKVVLWPRGGVRAAKSLTLTMALPAIDVCSWFSYAEKAEANR